MTEVTSLEQAFPQVCPNTTSPLDLLGPWLRFDTRRRLQATHIEYQEVPGVVVEVRPGCIVFGPAEEPFHVAAES
eukprot:1378286-Amorphochlora_amoeboformis.AAC.1